MHRFVGPLLILLATATAGALLFFYDRMQRRRNKGQDVSTNVDENSESPISEAESEAPHNGGICCGMHAVCEKTTLTPIDDKIVYYDDEELDRFRGRDADSYNTAEEEEFREVLMTLLPEDVAGWARSMQLRQINLPTAVRDELLMIVGELRNE